MGCLFYLMFAVLIWSVRLTILTVMLTAWILIATVILILACCGVYRRTGRRAPYPRWRWRIL